MFVDAAQSCYMHTQCMSICLSLCVHLSVVSRACPSASPKCTLLSFFIWFVDFAAPHIYCTYVCLSSCQRVRMCAFCFCLLDWLTASFRHRSEANCAKGVRPRRGPHKHRPSYNARQGGWDPGTSRSTCFSLPVVRIIMIMIVGVAVQLPQ